MIVSSKPMPIVGVHNLAAHFKVPPTANLCGNDHVVHFVCGMAVAHLCDASLHPACRQVHQLKTVSQMMVVNVMFERLVIDRMSFHAHSIS